MKKSGYSWQASAVVSAGVVPRLLRREQAAAYLNVSVPQLDNLRLTGEITPVPMPGRLGFTTRTVLYDVEDLAAAIARWKANRA